jgi:hypothetical protein
LSLNKPFYCHAPLYRFAGAPDKVKFLKGAMNVIDCLAIAPYFLTLFFMPPTELGGLGGDDLVAVQSVAAAAASEEPPVAAEDQEEYS